MEKLTFAQKEVARLLQLDIALVNRPFQIIGQASSLSEGEVLRITKILEQKGYIRRFAAILRHQKTGFSENALVVWAAPAELVQKAGNILASFDAVSHCYERLPCFQEKFNLFTMVHARNEDLLSIVKKMAAASGINDYLILESLQEYKKTSPEYFS